MKLYHLILIIFLSSAFINCEQGKKLETPLDTLKAYTEAIKKKDTAAMKSLLSKGSIKMDQEEAKAQNTSVDEVIQNETLFSPDQRVVEFRNQKIEGDSATIEVKNSYGSFDRIPFVKEDGGWKIAKEKVLEEMQKQADEDSRKLDEQINQGRQP
jgi:hypothetical protein